MPSWLETVIILLVLAVVIVVIILVLDGAGAFDLIAAPEWLP